LRSDQALATHYENGRAYAARDLELTGRLPGVLDETSGIAVSRTQPHVFWTHNDSGDGPHLYAIDPSGRLLATFVVGGAEARDWEDIGLGPCVSARSQTSPFCLYLGDIGDNRGAREWLTIYMVEEPTVPSRDDGPRTIASQSFRYRYPGGPDDAEALAVLSNGDLTIVTKGRSGTIGFFRLRREASARAIVSGEVLVAEYIGDSGIRPDVRISRNATGAAVSPDGESLAVRTYNEVFFYSAVNDAGKVSWRGPVKACFLGDAEPQGEAIDFLDRDWLVITSERRDRPAGLIHRVQC
jgi:hypothetical protein